MCGMATGDNTRLKKIGTSKILEKLKRAGGDSTQFFYLYVSTAGKERKKQTRKQVSGQQKLNFPPTHTEDEDNDDTESEDDQQMEVDEVDYTGNVTQQTQSLDGDNLVVEDNPSPALSKDKARKEAMNTVHKVVLPKVLSKDGWMKVHDKDMKLTYRALYFNIIQKHQDEDDIVYIKRVGNIRTTLAEEADKVKKQYDVNFKINSLLSKPFVYDEPTLVEQSLREESTQMPPKQRQLQIDDFVRK